MARSETVSVSVRKDFLKLGTVLKVIGKACMLQQKRKLKRN